MTAPTLEQFRDLARTRRVIPVIRTMKSDGQSAVDLYQKLATERAGTFLLESAEHGMKWSRYSVIGVASSAMISERDGSLVWSGNVPQGVPLHGDPIEALRSTLAVLNTPRVNESLVADALPPLTGGVVGYLGYDMVRRIERLPEIAPDTLNVPELAMLVATDLAVVDHETQVVTLIANAINYDNTSERVDQVWHDAIVRLDRMQASMQHDIDEQIKEFVFSSDVEYARETTSDDYQRSVLEAQERIKAGDAFQIVLSQRFATKCTASALDVYRALRASNPSPYMYLLRVPKVTGPDEALSDEIAFDVVGSSPEALVRLQDGQALLHPIAGTRPRGKDSVHDDALVEELLADKKERAEHLMLVDLGRNDLGRVCEPGTVEVTDFMSIEKYSHVMHIVSTVTGDLDPHLSAFDLVAATFPAGTLSGAPKPMAMSIIEELEPSRRGVYGGCVGYFDFAGNTDTAIAIRTAVIKDGVAYVQAGAGVVADSVASMEDAECQAKAAAVLRAVAAANRLSER